MTIDQLIEEAKMYAAYDLYFNLDDVKQYIKQAFEIGYNSGSNQCEDDGK